MVKAARRFEEVARRVFRDRADPPPPDCPGRGNPLAQRPARPFRPDAVEDGGTNGTHRLLHIFVRNAYGISDENVNCRVWLKFVQDGAEGLLELPGQTLSAAGRSHLAASHTRSSVCSRPSAQYSSHEVRSSPSCRAASMAAW